MSNQQRAWTQRNVKQAQTQLHELIAGMNDVVAPRDRARQLLQAVGQKATDPYRFVMFMGALRLTVRYGGLDREACQQILRQCDDLLKAAEIVPGQSKLAFLHADLASLRSQFHRSEGRFRDSQWDLVLAQAAGRGRLPGGSAVMAMAVANRSMRLGDADQAMTGFVLAENQSLAGSVHWFQARLGRIQALRLHHQIGDATQLETETSAHISSAPQHVQDTIRRELEWERLSCEAIVGKDPHALLNATGRGRPHFLASYVLDGMLWAYAHDSRSGLDRLSSTRSLKRSFGDQLRRGQPLHSTLQALQTLEKLYDRDIPVFDRLQQCGQLISLAREVLTVERELLILAAAARWLARHHQPQGAAIALQDYRALSRRLTSGQVQDVLQLVLDLEVSPWSRQPQEAIDKLIQQLEPIPALHTGSGQRLADLTKMSLAIGGVRLKSSFRRFFGNDDDLSRHQEYAAIAAQLLRGLGQMKGPSVKVAQIMGLAVTDLPDEVREALTAMQTTSQPVVWKQIQPIFEAEIGPEQRARLHNFDTNPVAAASIGQIHRAEVDGQHPVAVKIQYPGMEDAVRADLKLIRRLGPMLRFLFPAANVQTAIRRTEEHLLMECDYELEAKHQHAIREHFADDDEIVIPGVYPELSSKRVLTTDWLEGAHLNDFVRNANQAERNDVGRIIFKYCWQSLLKHGLYNADPHPGNFLVLPDGRVGCLDFGYVDEYPKERIHLVKKLMRSGINNDRQGYLDTIYEMGMVANRKEFNEQHPWEFADFWIGPYRAREAVILERAAGQRVASRLTLNSPNRTALTLPEADIRLIRFFVCLPLVLADLGAAVCWRDVLEPLVAEDDDGSSSGAA